MYDLQDFRVELTGEAQTVTLPGILITGRFLDPTTGEIVADLSDPAAGASIPDQLQLLTPDQFLELVRPNAEAMLALKAGVPV